MSYKKNHKLKKSNLNANLLSRYKNGHCHQAIKSDNTSNDK